MGGNGAMADDRAVVLSEPSDDLIIRYSSPHNMMTWPPIFHLEEQG